MDPPRLVVVLGEGAIRRMVGGPEVIRQQLQFLIHIQREKPIDLRVLPFDAGAHAAIGFTFWLLRHEDQAQPGTAYVEGLTRAAYFDQHADPEDVIAYRNAFDRILAAALRPKESISLLVKVMSDL